jgi:heat-inducible transcriptional repressor
VQNRVIFTARDYTQTELQEAANYLNAHYAGLTMEVVRERLQAARSSSCAAKSPSLMQAAVQAGTDPADGAAEQVVISGERNLLAVQDFGHDLVRCAGCSTSSSRRPS